MKKEYTNADVYDFLERECQHDEALWKKFGAGILSRTTDTDFWDSLSEQLDCLRVCNECGKPMIESLCEMIMNETKIKIPAGGMYQEWMSLIDLVEADTAKKLESLANSKGWRETQPKEALDMGFEELVNWPWPENDVLALVADNYFMCLNKEYLMVKLLYDFERESKKYLEYDGEAKTIEDIYNKKRSLTAFTIVSNENISIEGKHTQLLPVYSVRAACGSFNDYNRIPEDEAEGWVDVSGAGFRPNDKMFVVHAIGDSMQPKIHDGDLCVFELYGSENAGSREGKIVLTKCRNKDSEYDCSFTIKEYHSKKIEHEDGSWEHEWIRLKSINTQYPTIEITPADAENDCTVGVFRKVL